MRAARRLPAPPTGDRYLFDVRPEILLRIREPQTSLAVWQRRPASDVLAQARMVSPAEGTVRRSVAVDTGFARDLDLALEAALAPGTGVDEVAALRSDLALLLHWARRIAPDCRALPLRIARVEGDGCRLFHSDQVALRMICTYAGAGTQWLRESAVDRAALGQGNNDGVLDWAAVRQLATGEVAVMKGARFAGPGPGGLIHRSPPKSDTSRCTVVIDIDG
ncbi:DUF1826 domain-containing protein [Luteimonas sp. FCS-9]|uniref:DUF1826 domain-containing protein n=1 Tax=Luteimonas sp. FCS-9 TaxID=1547516 RepID=UPI00069B394A|nr:DUF1826 domain-containing protein [Luteimonas sp. FCS-9]